MVAIEQADPTAQLADYIEATRYEHVPAHVIAAIKKSFLDTIGAGIAGRSTEIGRIVSDMARENGGKEEATLWTQGDRVPAAEAAFANAVMARCRELDDVHEGSPRVGRGHGGHVNVMLVPSALATVESLRGPTSGKDLISALAVGGDLIPRLRMAAGNAGRLGWEGPTLAPFGVAATVAKLRGFDRTTTASALGTAYAHCAGNILSTSDGTWDVWLNAAAAALTLETRVCFWIELSGSAGSGASVGPLFTSSLRSSVPSGASPAQKVSNQETVGASRSGAGSPLVGAPEGSSAEVPCASVVAGPPEVPVPVPPEVAAELGAALPDLSAVVVAPGLGVAVSAVPDEQPTISTEHAAIADKNRAARCIPAPSPTMPRQAGDRARRHAEFCGDDTARTDLGPEPASPVGPPNDFGEATRGLRGTSPKPSKLPIRGCAAVPPRAVTIPAAWRPARPPR